MSTLSSLRKILAIQVILKMQGHKAFRVIGQFLRVAVRMDETPRPGRGRYALWQIRYHRLMPQLPLDCQKWCYRSANHPAQQHRPIGEFGHIANSKHNAVLKLFSLSEKNSLLKPDEILLIQQRPQAISGSLFRLLGDMKFNSLIQTHHTYLHKRTCCYIEFNIGLLTDIRV